MVEAPISVSLLWRVVVRSGRRVLSISAGERSHKRLSPRAGHGYAIPRPAPARVFINLVTDVDQHLGDDAREK